MIRIFGEVIQYYSIENSHSTTLPTPPIMNNARFFFCVALFVQSISPKLKYHMSAGFASQHARHRHTSVSFSVALYLSKFGGQLQKKTTKIRYTQISIGFVSRLDDRVRTNIRGIQSMKAQRFKLTANLASLKWSLLRQAL